ncbi:hypothetical protein [Notoacmeibacter sp. MSK16QG-6]|uniref:hypothetical protein n=1 Tax=Notoacmeibacter sp. MSK16QG-6 TaxID=2957982 RepID=UPI00209F4984|nr:hypothetical protein [Notoacmeibacter sp. MSK16QG-6]MCP1201102.1 hypothetical protein [Notoacmeibacter sp. MSK16QG-6]
MPTKPLMVAFGSVLFVITLAGCASLPKEKSAPCKRPANASAYADDPRHDCGPMQAVNGDEAAAMAALEEMRSADRDDTWKTF